MKKKRLIIALILAVFSVAMFVIMTMSAVTKRNTVELKIDSYGYIGVYNKETQSFSGIIGGADMSNITGRNGRLKDAIKDAEANKTCLVIFTALRT